MAKQTKTQADARRFQRMFDQHRRPWDAVIEISTGDWCGGLIPQFEAPLMPPLKYLRTVPGKPWRLHIDYQSWLNDDGVIHAERTTRIRELCGLRYGQAALEPGFKIPLEVYDYVGKEPPPLQRIRAAMSGHPWVLGTDGRGNGKWIGQSDGTGRWESYRGNKPVWAEKYFPTPAPTGPELGFMDGDLSWMNESPAAPVELEQQDEIEEFLAGEAPADDVAGAPAAEFVPSDDGEEPPVLTEQGAKVPRKRARPASPEQSSASH